MLRTHARWIALLTIATLTVPAFASKDGWGTDFAAAKKMSKETGKPIVAEFTGSDWCGFCIKQNEEVFSKDEFKAWAKKNAILLEVDFPTQAVEQSEELKAQNAKMKKDYGVEGFPTVVFMTHEGKELERFGGYRPGTGVEKWLKKAEGIVDAYDPNFKPGQYTPGKWTEDYQTALAASRKTGKPILADFTGSDWCGWCIKLKGEVFEHDEFKAWAKKNVILLELDYPRQKEQSAKIKKQNVELRDKYKIRGYPTILFIDHDGEVIGRSGYKPGGPEVWTADAQQHVDKYEPAPDFKEGEAEEHKDAEEGDGGVAKINEAWLEGPPQLRERLAGLEGRQPPALAVSTWINSEEMKLEDLKGKVVLVDFWATWCGPCLASIPHTNQLMDKYGKQGLVIIGVCHPRGGENMAATAEQRGIKYPLALDKDGKTAEAYKVNGFPDYYFIDRAGKLRIADCKNNSVEAAIKALLAEPGNPKEDGDEVSESVASNTE